MAIGDDAAAAGLAVYAATQDLRKGYENDNQRGDEIAHEITNRAAAITAATTALNAAIAAGLATKANLAHTHGIGDIGGGTWTGPVAAGGNAVTGGNFASSGNVDVAGGLTTGGHITPQGHIFLPNAAPASSGYVALYRNGDGRVSVSPSSRRFKKEIKAWSPDLQAVLAMQLVTYRLKAAIYGDAGAPVDVGLIAEDLDALGLEWLVFYDDDGLPLGVHYERVALALLPAVQELAAEAQDHEARISALEENR